MNAQNAVFVLDQSTSDLKLQILNLRGCPQFSSAQLVEIGSNNQSLKEYRIDGSDQIPVFFAVTILMNLECLESFYSTPDDECPAHDWETLKKGFKTELYMCYTSK